MTTASNSPILRTIPLVIAAYLLSLPVYAKYGGGTGEPKDPFLIYTAEQMNAIGADANDWDKHLKLMADIDLRQLDGPWQPIKQFSGVFDGNDHVIKNFGHTERVVGFFYYVHGYNAIIKNLGLIDPNVHGVEYVGALVGTLRGTIQGCYVQGGTVKGDTWVGGLVGECFEGRIEDCKASAEVVASKWFGGGLVGSASGIISNCSSGGAVSGDTVGGLVGLNRAIISDCYSTAYVSGPNDLGGLVGQNGRVAFNYQYYMLEPQFIRDEGVIHNSYAIARVEGNDGVGGLVGHNIAGTITRCSSDGQVSGANDVGGLVGKQGYCEPICIDREFWPPNECKLYKFYRSVGELRNCFSRATVAGNDRIGGLVGYNLAGSITGCYSVGPTEGATNAGGSVGQNGWWCKYYPSDRPFGFPDLYESVGEVRNCYSRGDVKGLDTVGGLVGYNGAGTIANSYCTGPLTGDKDVGGLVGANDNGTVTYCFWGVQTSGRGAMCGYRGLGGIGCNNANGKTTTEMQTASTFLDAGWDFVNVWGIGENQTYPYLRKHSAADINQDESVDFGDLAILAENWLSGVAP